MRRFGAILPIIVCAASICRAEVASIPDWLPEDQRFEVEGTSNEIAQVGQTLALMRDALHPMMRPVVEREDMLGPCIQWVVRLCKPGVTNEADYLSAAAHPDVFRVADFNRAVLTNRMSRLSRLPTAVKLRLVYGLEDKTRRPVDRALPGVDYPGVASEDAGSTEFWVRIVMRAPKWSRRFRVETEPAMPGSRPIEFRWARIKGSASLERTGKKERWGCWNIYSNHARALANGGERIAVFAREKGGFWGPPSFIDITADNIGIRKYTATWAISSIDYGDFRDEYILGENDVILGFVRYNSGMLHGDKYSSSGELVVEGYSDERPKTTRKVKYDIVNGKLTYEVLSDDIHYKNGPMQVRKY